MEEEEKEKAPQQSLEQFGKHDNLRPLLLLLQYCTLIQPKAITICKNCDSQALMAVIYLIKVEHTFIWVENLEIGTWEDSSCLAFPS